MAQLKPDKLLMWGQFALLAGGFALLYWEYKNRIAK